MPSYEDLEDDARDSLRDDLLDASICEGCGERNDECACACGFCGFGLEECVCTCDDCGEHIDDCTCDDEPLLDDEEPTPRDSNGGPGL